ncbi:hypothetical protein TNIN_70741 [Trichonephila inaurata madagascariensis]|uniref:Uncharacterized protein n=1 Tax=Trichonephila inaurata madagascariensis TaxID=2747483 RepID=A0A8X6Y2D3_9ARAC|nr:hypothetical protein TNIN_70741 [Trichonephila inaurata madagascariensis]
MDVDNFITCAIQSTQSTIKTLLFAGVTDDNDPTLIDHNRRLEEYMKLQQLVVKNYVPLYSHPYYYNLSAAIRETTHLVPTANQNAPSPSHKKYSRRSPADYCVFPCLLPASTPITTTLQPANKEALFSPAKTFNVSRPHSLFSDETEERFTFYVPK